MASAAAPHLTTDPYFSSASFQFFKGLAENNSREWFAAHRDDYEQQVRTPFLRLIADLQEPLTRISPHYIADPRPVGGSLFRIHRDTRFGNDKSPYKTWGGARFYHRRSAELSGEAPVFYLHIQPGESFLGGGLWHPSPDALGRVRDYLVNNPDSWQKILRAKAFKGIYTLGGESLTRAPRGYDPQHPLIADLRRKDFVCSAPLSDDVVLSAELLAVVVDRFKKAAPLVDWLCGVLDLEF
jgi:uncharacterized protein (TIGR02453 family)